VLLVAAAGLAAGCGSDDEEGAGIPVAAAEQLQSRLVEVRNRFEFGGGACEDIANDSAPAVDEIIQSLPDDVDPDVRDALRQGFDRLFELSAEQCESEEAQTETEAEPPPETATTPTETTPTETTPTETTPPETTPPDTTEPAPPEEPGTGEGDDESGGGVGPEDDG
jgi:hypothetical protein